MAMAPQEPRQNQRGAGNQQPDIYAHAGEQR